MTMPAPYHLRRGSPLDRSLLVRTMQHTYEELRPHQVFPHLAQTVDAYLCADTPIWWLELGIAPEITPGTEQQPAIAPQRPAIIGCLWLGNAVDQISGQRHTHIFLLYVHPAHRRQGLGTALMTQAETWAREHGHTQISLQVFHNNAIALHLYETLGYHPQSIALVKPLT